MLNKPAQPEPGKGTQAKTTSVGMLRRDDKAGATGGAATDRAAAALVIGALLFVMASRRAFRGALGD